MSSTYEILDEVYKQREYQKNKWGNDADDTKNLPNDWIAYIVHHSSKWFEGGFPAYTTEEVNNFRTCMIKTAALAVAAIESVDRQRNNTGQCFYEGI